ncbi:NUDIX domain-containing protein [Methanobacterium aggregans]|uniref:NUDIX domain-containing protein n=1 Tax=Methanobacterium aggregans TaxID=1615586 RepID=UPI001FD987CA|nr:NUDIX hydrolase [Methanobacterium aggregans]MBP2045847.1 8-oxo-dGTP diphosphatase [Methanobacterium aggregans]
MIYHDNIDGRDVCKESVCFVLIKRKNEPYKDFWALPGGFVEYGETVESAASREAKEETGLEIDLKGIIGVYSDPKRDPRGHTVSIAFLARKAYGDLVADTDANDARYFGIDEIRDIDLAFDHRQIIEEGISMFNRNEEGFYRNLE